MRRAAKRLYEDLAPETAANLRSSAPSSRLLIVSKQTGDPRGLNGLGIFAPFVTDPGDLKRLGLDRESASPIRRREQASDDVVLGRDAYKRLQLVVGTPWERLVYDTLRAGLPADVLDSFQASGAASLEDRSAVSQMLAAVDSLFDGLDRRIDRARRVVLQDTKRRGLPTTRTDPDKFLELELVSHKAVRKAAKPPAKNPGTGGRVSAKVEAPTSEMLAGIAAFTALEATLSDLERSVQRTLTNGTFGLGPGPGGSAWQLPAAYDKAGGGQGVGDKAGGGQGAPGDKAGGGQGPPPEKAGGGQGPPSASDVTQLALAAIATNPPLLVAELFGEVGRALRAIEKAAGAVETLVAHDVVSGGIPAMNGAPSKMQVTRGFRILAESSTQARRVLRRVLAHPIYGFGRGAENLTAEDRRELARAGGLSSLQLQLM